MIPKVIHYCWFGRNPLPKLAQKCIASWQKYFPDHEIKEWNEDNFDVSMIPYTAEAYEAKKYAFVSDYARMWILYKYGGLYFDTDVEVIRPFDDILAHGSFMGCEIDACRDGESADAPSIEVNPGLGLGATPGLGLYKDLLDYYGTLHFRRPDGTYDITTVVKNTTKVLFQNGLEDAAGIQQVAGVTIYPRPYFNPLQVLPTGKVLKIEECTHSIHHYAATWLTPRQRFEQCCKHALMAVFGGKNVLRVINLLRGSK